MASFRFWKRKFPAAVGNTITIVSATKQSQLNYFKNSCTFATIYIYLSSERLDTVSPKRGRNTGVVRPLTPNPSFTFYPSQTVSAGLSGNGFQLMRRPNLS